MAIHIKTPPDAKPERISRLITRLEDGDIKIPVFQRQFVWRQSQVIELLDSIYRGYPIGSLQFWLSKEKLVPARDLGGFPLPKTKDEYPRNYVLDGQQRLTTIYGVLKWEGKPEDESDFNVCFDLLQEDPDKAFVPTPEVVPATYVPMNILFDTRRFRTFQQSLLARKDSESLLAKTDVLLETFREYSIPVVTVTEPTIEQVASIFERINSTGTKLTVFDLMIAATWSADFDLRTEFHGSLEELGEKEYGDVSPVAMLQVLAAHTQGSAKKETILGLRKQSATDLREKMATVREAMKKAVDFLVNDVHVKSLNFLPYERQLVVISYVYSKKTKLTAAENDVLRRWFWRTSFAERYRRGGEGLFDEDLRKVIEAFKDPKVLASFGNPPTAKNLIAAEFRKGSALASALVALLASASPRNLVNGSAIDTAKALSTYNRKEFHHVFPQAYLRGRGVPIEETNSLVNFCLLAAEQNKLISDRPPAEYIPEIEQALGNQFIPVLESNLIPASAVSKLKANDYAGFQEVRGKYLAEMIAKRI